MNDWRNMKTILAFVAMMFFLSLVYTILTGCSRTVKSVSEVHDTTYIATHSTDTLVQTETRTDTVYESRTDTIHDYHVYHDSVIAKDSVYVREKGDSVYVYKEKWNTRYVEKKDTIYRSKVDTLWRVHSDTVYIDRTSAVVNTTNHVIDTNKETVKQKRNWLSWGRWLVPLLFLCGIGWIVWKYVKGR